MADKDYLSRMGTQPQVSNRRLPSRGSLVGLTLVEMMVVVAILAILLSIALPNLTEMLARTRLDSAADELVADINFARSEAAARGTRVVICPRSTGDATLCGTSAEWINGRIIFVDLNADGVRDTAETNISRLTTGSLTNTTLALSGYTPSSAFVSFSPYGGLNPAGSSGIFLFCTDGYASGRQVAVSIAGRPSLSWTPCP